MNRNYCVLFLGLIHTTFNKQACFANIQTWTPRVLKKLTFSELHGIYLAPSSATREPRGGIVLRGQHDAPAL
jgi:hypothetical protein